VKSSAFISDSDVSDDGVTDNKQTTMSADDEHQEEEERSVLSRNLNGFSFNDLSNSPNFLPAKLSRYMVFDGSYRAIATYSNSL